MKSLGNQMRKIFEDLGGKSQIRDSLLVYSISLYFMVYREIGNPSHSPSKYIRVDCEFLQTPFLNLQIWIFSVFQVSGQLIEMRDNPP